MLKRMIALVLCAVLAAALAPTVHALPVRVERESVDRCCDTLRVNPLDVNYVRPDYEGYLIDITPQRVADTFAYLDEFYVRQHPEAALTVYTGTEQDRENLKKLAETITEGCATDREKANAVDSWLLRNIFYDVNTSAYATDTFYRRTGNCLSYANLMQFLLRSLDIPAVVGDGWRGDMKTSTVDLFNYEGHAWCFVLLEGEWVLYDPLWITGGTTDRDYMAEWIYFDTVEFICPASDGDNLPPVAYDKPVPYYTDGKVHMYSAAFPQGNGTLTCFVNNQVYVFVSNQCEGEYLDGWVYLDEGKSKDGMDRGEIYRDSWLSFGDYSQNNAMALTYAFPNGMMPDGYVMNYDGRDWYMSGSNAVPVLMDEADYVIQDGLVTLKPGYTGAFLGLPWQDGCIHSPDEDRFVTWTSLCPEVATVDQNGVITCHSEGYAEFQITLQQRESNGDIGYMGGSYIMIFVSDEDRTPDYTDYDAHEHVFECIDVMEADCISWGYEIQKCIYCPATQEAYTTPPLGHDYADHVCTRCGQMDPDWNDSLPHGTCGDNLTWVLTEDGTLTISGNGYMDELYMEEENVIYCPWGTLQDQVRRVVVKPGVRSIGSAAFYRHSNLTSVSLPEGLESIGWSAFYDCPNLTSVYLSEGLLHIGDHAFAYCEALPTLSIPDGTLTIGKEALYNCYSLTTLDVPDSVTAIGDYAFMGCLGVTDLNIPDAITRIGDYTYACCGITSAEIPEGVTEIGEYAFWGCEQMEQLTIPNTVTRIGSNAFRACVSLVSVTIPDSVERIESEAFAICEGLEEINLGNGITSIETRAFYDCVKLQSVTFPKSLTYLADHAFEWCPSLKTITFQGSAPEVGEEPVIPYASITIFYPANDPTWTEAEMQKYGVNKTWVSHDVPSAYTVKWSSISTSLGGNIAMNFYVELSENLVSDPDAYIQFSFAGRTLKVALSEGKPSDKNGVTVYQFSCPITSKNMTDEITAQVYNADGAVGEPKSMSVDTYCNWVIANFKDQKTVNLMKGMLNYGASAQKLFNYRTDDLANATLAEEDKVFGAVDASAYKHSVTGTEEGIITKSMTLLLDSETTVRVYFELTGDKTIDQYTFTVDGVEVEPKFKDGKYYIERPNISAHRLDDMHVFTCGGITVTYGGLSYVNQVMTYYTEGATFEMASALYAYSKAAEAYIG